MNMGEINGLTKCWLRISHRIFRRTIIHTFRDVTLNLTSKPRQLMVNVKWGLTGIKGSTRLKQTITLLTLIGVKMFKLNVVMFYFSKCYIHCLMYFSVHLVWSHLNSHFTCDLNVMASLSLDYCETEVPNSPVPLRMTSFCQPCPCISNSIPCFNADLCSDLTFSA